MPWSVEEIDAACREVLKANELTDAYMRPVAWRGSEQMGVARRRTKPHLAIAAWEWGKYFDPALGRQGHPARHRAVAPARALHRAGPFQGGRPVHDLHPVASSMPKRAAIDDALMFDWRGQVAEATGANVFFVRDGELHTPTPDCFLDGITRRTVMDLAEQRGIEVIERAIWPEELEEVRADVPDRHRRRSDLGPVGRPVEVRGRRPVAPAGSGL